MTSRKKANLSNVPLRITNRDARRLWLSAQGLAHTPTGQIDLDKIIKDLGFVQLDTIQVVARAHHHIIWSRNQNYREPMLERHMAERRIFEHFTHDASIIPMDFYAFWRRQFRRLEQKIRDRQWFSSMTNAKGREAIKTRIRNEGPLSTKAFDTKPKKPKEMWSRPPHKLALDYMWFAGELSTSHRKNFAKFYDLTERVIPATQLKASKSEKAQLHWLCASAIDRLGFGTVGDIQRFWDAVDNAEAKEWVTTQSNSLVNVEIEGADKVWRPAFAPKDIVERLKSVPSPTTRLRILNPFDPVIRDRTRLWRLFGFEYVVEMFVPAAKRRWGYYVYPLLEGDRFVGRIELKADRKAGELTVLNLWPESKVKWTTARAAKLQAELCRLGRFAGLDHVTWTAGTLDAS